MNNNFLGGRDIRKCSLLRNEGAAEGGARWWRLWGSPSEVARTVHVLLDYVHKVTVVQGRKKNEEYTIWPGGVWVQVIIEPQTTSTLRAR